MSNNSNKKVFLIILLLLVFYNNCDHGLSPPEVQLPRTGISGTIYYKNWMVSDSLYRLRLVLFKNYPPVDVFDEIFEKRAIVYPDILNERNLPYFEDSTSYFFSCPADSYQYLVVAQQYKSFLFSQESWRVVGQYDTTLSDTLPTSLCVIQDSILQSININVDFDSLPPQPF